MAVPEAPTDGLRAFYRAVGKLGYGHNGPTHSTDFAEQAQAMRIGGELVESGVWTEFYVKVIYRHRRLARAD